MKRWCDGMWSDGSCVGRVDNFKNKRDFAEWAMYEMDIEGDIEQIEKQVKLLYARWYSIPPFNIDWDFEEGCYSLSSKGKGAFKVYVLEN